LTIFDIKPSSEKNSKKNHSFGQGRIREIAQPVFSTKKKHISAQKKFAQSPTFFFAQFGDCSRQQFGWRDVGRVCTKFGKSSLRGGHTKVKKIKTEEEKK